MIYGTRTRSTRQQKSKHNFCWFFPLLNSRMCDKNQQRMWIGFYSREFNHLPPWFRLGGGEIKVYRQSFLDFKAFSGVDLLQKLEPVGFSWFQKQIQEKVKATWRRNRVSIYHRHDIMISKETKQITFTPRTRKMWNVENLGLIGVPFSVLLFIRLSVLLSPECHPLSLSIRTRLYNSIRKRQEPPSKEVVSDCKQRCSPALSNFHGWKSK